MKPKLLWLVGVEGSGHHLVPDVLRDFLNRQEVADKDRNYPLWIQRWDHLQDPLPISTFKNLLERIVADYQVVGCSHFYEDTSFSHGGVEPQFSKYIPGGNHRGLRRHPGIADLLELMAELVDYRILVIYRSPQCRPLWGEGFRTIWNLNADWPNRSICILRRNRANSLIFNSNRI